MNRQVYALLHLGRGQVARAVLWGFLASAASIALLLTSAWLITRAAEHPLLSALSLAIVLVRGLGVTRAVMRYVERLYSHDVALAAVNQTRLEVYSRLARFPVNQVLPWSRAELTAHWGSSLERLSDLLTRVIVPVGVAALSGLTVVATLAALWWPAALASTMLWLLVVALIALAMRRSAGLTARVHEAQLRVRTHVAQSIDTLELATGPAAQRQLDRVEAAQAQQRRALVAAQRSMSWATGSANVAGAAASALVLALVQFHEQWNQLPALAWLPLVGQLPAPELAPAWLAVVVLGPLAMGEALASLPAAVLAWVGLREPLGQLADVLRHTPDRRPAGTWAAEPIVGLELQDVVAGHTPTAPIAAGLAHNLRMAPGDTVVVRGASGCGKSTLLLTAAGMIPPLAGQVWAVSAGGERIALQDVDPGHLRRWVHWVAEDAHIFGTTVAENLRLFAPEAGDEDLHDALTAVGLQAWLNGLVSEGDPLDTPLRSLSEELSGGQRRRLLLARAILSQARVLILDEPAAHLDAGSASDVIITLRRGNPQLAILFTSHEPETQQSAHHPPRPESATEPRSIQL